MCSFIIALSYISKLISQAQFNYTKMSKKNTTRLVPLRNVQISSDASRVGAQTVRITSYGGSAVLVCREVCSVYAVVLIPTG